MALVTGIGSIDFNQFDDSNPFDLTALVFASSGNVPFSSGMVTVNFLGNFSSGYGAEDNIVRVELDTGLGVNAVIDNVGLTDIRISNNLFTATQEEMVAYVLRGDDEFNMSSANDTVDGYDGNDEIRASGGNDSVDGSAGDDTLRGGTGVDTLLGGDGNDSIVGQAESDRASGGSGEDIIKGGGGDDQLSGGPDNDFLKGGTDQDVVLGGDGDDLLSGNAGSDTLLGGRGNDNLNGGGESDAFLGGRGRDTMKGGDGSDVFVFANNHGHDVILDFDATDDNEKINFVLNDDINSFSDVQNATQQVGNHVLITTSSNSSILLRNVDVIDLDANDFSF